MEHINIRVFYTKHGRLKYISHLDVNRLMQRVLKKADIPVWYTEGFNPHMYLTFALPLSLGAESDYEIMDFRVTENMPFEEIKARLNAAMPEGMEVLRATAPKQKVNTIASAVYRVELLSETLSPNALADKLQAYLDQAEILVEKKTKRKGIKTVDIKPDIQMSALTTTENGIVCTLTLPAGERTVNPSLVTDSFAAYAMRDTENPIHLTRTCRTAVLDAEGNLFE